MIHITKKNIFSILIFFLSTISINFLTQVYALEVKPNDTLTFEVSNSITSIGDLENVTVTVLEKPSFLILTNSINNETFMPGVSGKIRFTVWASGDGS